MAIINVLLLILGYLFLGKTFGFWTTYCSLMYSFETWVLERVWPMDKPFTDQPLMELFFAMMLPAVGSALLFNYNASSGGTDIVAMILKKYTSISDIGKALFVSDSVIATVFLLLLWRGNRYVLHFGPVPQGLCGGFRH